MEMYLFSTPNCPGCKILERRFTDKKISFEKVDCTDGTDKSQLLVARCHVKNSVPVTAILDKNELKYWEAGTGVDINEVESIMAGER